MMSLPWVICLLVVSCFGWVNANDNYVLRPRIVVERSQFDKWKSTSKNPDKEQLKKEIHSVFLEVNDIFDSIRKYNMNIKVVIQHIAFMDGNIVTEQNTVQDDFVDWLKKNPLSKEVDLSILFSSKTLTNLSPKEKMLGQICTEKSVIVMGLKGWYYDAMSISHEIAHVLGAKHEGAKSDNLPKDCKMENGYYNIMDTNGLEVYEKPYGKQFYFSHCAYYMMYTTIKKLQNNCLKNEDTSSVVSVHRMGEMLTVDEMCQRRFGMNSFAMRDHSWIYDSDFHCQSIKCYTKSSKTIIEPYPWLYCGKDKQCVKAKCTYRPSERSATIKDHCPFGNQPRLLGKNYKTCNDIIPKSESECSIYKYECCEICDLEDFSKADKFCRSKEGGKSSFDRFHYKIKDYGSQMCSKDGLACKTEAGNPKYPKSNLYTAPDNLSCGKSKRCVDKKCVVTADGNPTMPDTCPYGKVPVFLKDSYFFTFLPCDYHMRKTHT